MMVLLFAPIARELTSLATGTFFTSAFFPGFFFTCPSLGSFLLLLVVSAVGFCGITRCHSFIVVCVIAPIG